MPESIPQALDALEQITAAVLALGEAPLQSGEFQNLLSVRGALVEELGQFLKGASSVSESEYRRLVLIHSEGQQLAGRLASTRQQIAEQLLQAATQQAYQHCLSGMLPPENAPARNCA